MANSSYVQVSFLGGEISQAAQGRYDLPSYKISMNVCLNAIPIESGAWMRRPGSRNVATTRGGAPGRLIPFAFAQNFPYQMEFTDGFLRFTTGPALVMTNDSQALLTFDTNNPVNVATPLPHGWSAGQSVVFSNLGVNNPLLQNRVFKIKTVPNANTISLVDAITGANINGATLGAFVSGTISRVLEIVTTYTGGSWSTLRSVQAETRTVLLNGSHPQVLQVASPPSASQFATFTYGPADFIDGPYLDPVSGSFASPTALNGVITLTLSFQAYDATRAYNIGDFVTSGGNGYKSLTSLNQNNNPATSPLAWTPVNGGAVVNNGQGFLSSDIGRLVRLLSEPALWSAATSYSINSVVAYPDGNGGFSYWTATGSPPAGTQPGTSPLWALNATGSVWTWGQITSVSGSGLITPATAIGTLGGGGGLAAAFDGNNTKSMSAASNFSASVTTYPVWTASNFNVGTTVQYNGFAWSPVHTIFNNNPSGVPLWGPGSYQPGTRVIYGSFVYISLNVVVSNNPPPTEPGNWAVSAFLSTAPPAAPNWSLLGPMSNFVGDLYIGQHYTTPQAVQSATLWPTTDIGIANSYSPTTPLTIAVFLRGKATAPTTPSDGTILAQTTIANTTSPVTLTSTDRVTTWNYVWLEISANYVQPLPDNGSHVYAVQIGVSQAQFYGPTASNGSVAQVQIRGPALLYNQTIRTWRLGVYSDTTGWPPCGTYHEGRIWFGGVVSNRFDASVSNGLNGVALDFTPTSPDGSVAGNNAISYICTGEDSNQIEWMTPDQQGILFGTRAGEWLISAPAAGPLAPTNIKAVRVTKIGCANIEPKRAEHTLLIVQKFGRKVVEYFADVFSGKFSAPNLSERAKHMTVKGIVEIAYQQELAPILWARRSDGALIGATYKRDTLTTSQGPNIIGWHRHGLGSGRLVESIAVGPSQAGNLDALSMITNDPNTGIRHIEMMTDLLDEGFALTDCWFLDDAIVPSSTVVQVGGGPNGSLLVNGLWPHNGKTVTAWIAGLDCGEFTVANGSITVPFGDSVSAGAGAGLLTAALVQSFTTLPAVIGFNYNSDGQLVRPVTQADTGAQAGPGFGKIGRQSRYAVQLYGAVPGSIAFGTDFTTLDPARLRQANDAPLTVQQQWSGIWRDNISSDLDFDGMIAWRISRPYPAFVMAVGGFTSKADV